MKTRVFVIALLLVAVLTSCGGDGFRTFNGGLIVEVQKPRPDGARLVRVEVLGEGLFHVSATPEENFADPQSLMVTAKAGDADYHIEDLGESVTIGTQEVTATIAKQTGEVTFTDYYGNLILAEESGGRTFKPYEAGGVNAYSVRQVFQSAAPDEGYYGLGQHQADEFNYKGKNEELFQYNTKVSVPFVVSSKNYGVLWDSNSLVRFGNPEDYKQLGQVFDLYDKYDRPGALTGTYWSPDSQVKTLVTREDSIYFEHLKRGDLSHVVNLPDFPLNGSHVYYEGSIVPKQDGEYKFILYYAGYMKVYIGNELVVPERWRTAWNPNSYKFNVDLKAGERIPIKLEWKPDGGVSYCGLRVMDLVPEEEQNKLSWWSEMQKQEDYYFVYGENMDEVISGYRTLTGKAQIMPEWAMGYWQSRERYNTQEELVQTLQEFRNRHVPIDNIVQDWFYWPQDKWGDHDFDPARFPDPKKMVDDVHALNGHIMISVWPKFYANTDNYKAFDEHGWMYQQAVKDSIRDWVGPGYIGSFYDAYDPDARKLFWQQMREKLYPFGFDAWWMDASEPNIRDCTDIRYRKDLSGPTALGPTDEYFNAYALMNAEAIYDGQRSVDPDRRVFLLTRSGFGGLQRYSTATWSGDIATRWEDMKAQISAGLNFAMSGIPYWTMDIGGFCVENRYVYGQRLYDQFGTINNDLLEWRELNTRWYQFGAFCPLYRAHGQFPLREIWNIAPEDHPAYQSILYYTKLRYSLMPYIYSLAGMTHFNDYTIMRPLVMDYTSDVRVNNIGDQFMFGPSLMVAPVYQYGARTRDMYFPQGEGWYDYYTGRFIQGGQQLVVDAPYERIPLYVPAGAILAFGPDMEFTRQKPASEILVYVYAGKDGHFTLYEDEGVNYNYEKGKYAMIPLNYDDASGTLTIADRQGSFDGMLQQRTFRVIQVSADHPVETDPHSKRGVVVNYNGKEVSVKLTH